MGELLPNDDESLPTQEERRLDRIIEKQRDEIERLRDLLAKLVDATEDTLRSHAKATECCTGTRQRCADARAFLAELGIAT